VEAATPGMLEGDALTLLQSLRPFLSPADAAVFTEDYAEFVLDKIRRASSRAGRLVDDDIAFMTAWVSIWLRFASLCCSCTVSRRAVPFPTASGSPITSLTSRHGFCLMMATRPSPCAGFPSARVAVEQEVTPFRHRTKERKMNLQDCIQFATEHPICFFATMDGDQPRVRALALWFANETASAFHLSPSSCTGN